MTKRKAKSVDQQANLEKIISNSKKIKHELLNFQKEKRGSGRTTIHQVLEPIRHSLLGMKERHANGDISYNDIVAILKKYDIHISANSLGKYCRDELGYQPTKAKSKKADAKEEMAESMLDEMEKSQEPTSDQSKSNPQSDVEKRRLLGSFDRLI